MPDEKPQACPECGADLRSIYNSDFLWVRWCYNCRWNDIPVKGVTKERYQWWSRLSRLMYRAHQSYPPLRKQYKHFFGLVKDDLYAQEVPRSLQQHLEEAQRWPKNRAWKWIYRSKSRWEYHSMLRDGRVTSWKEFEDLIKDRRRADEEYEAWLIEQEEHGDMMGHYQDRYQDHEDYE